MISMVVCVVPLIPKVTGAGVKVAPKLFCAGEKVVEKSTSPLKDPIEYTVIGMSVLELWTRTTWVTGDEKLKSLNTSVTIRTGDCAGLCGDPPLEIPVTVIG